MHLSRKRYTASGRGRRSIVAVALLLCLGAADEERDETWQTYVARHRSAADLVERIAPLLTDGVKTAADSATNTVVVAGEPAAVSQLVGVLEQLDRPARRLVVHYTAIDPGDVAQWSETGSSSNPASRLRVRPLEPGREGRPGARRLAARSGREQDFAGTLRLLEGEVGRLVSGRALPLERVGLGWLCGPWLGVEGYESLESGLEVRAVVLADDRIRLALRTYVQGGEDARSELGETQAETVVVVEPDAPVLVAAAAARTPSREGFSARSRRDGREARALLVRVVFDPQAEAAPAAAETAPE
ncbi:MAG: secretin N-terminal domain-containing protein [Myxococcota bacterium]